jgi:hypothetical protein
MGARFFVTRQQPRFVPLLDRLDEGPGGELAIANCPRPGVASQETAQNGTVLGELHELDIDQGAESRIQA